MCDCCQCIVMPLHLRRSFLFSFRFSLLRWGRDGWAGSGTADPEEPQELKLLILDTFTLKDVRRAIAAVLGEKSLTQVKLVKRIGDQGENLPHRIIFTEMLSAV